jgi:hypothetical protein
MGKFLENEVFLKQTRLFECANVMNFRGIGVRNVRMDSTSSVNPMNGFSVGSAELSGSSIMQCMFGMVCVCVCVCMCMCMYVYICMYPKAEGKVQTQLAK